MHILTRTHGFNSRFGLRHVGFFASAVATDGNASIVAPAGIIRGDLLVLLDRVSTTSVPTTVVPSGFTTIRNDNDATAVRMITSYKIADGTEGGASITGMVAGTFEDGKAMAVFRGNVPITGVTIGSSSGQIVNTNPTGQNVVASGGLVPLIVFGAFVSNTAVDPRSFTPAKDAEINPDTLLYLAWKIYNAAPSDTAIDMDDEGNGNGLQSFYLQLT